MNENPRETLQSRLGFLLLTAGCAIGLGNIWRFPFMVGASGGAYFVFTYLFFLLILGFPVMVMELAAGRASRKTLYGAYKNLPRGSRFKWHIPGFVFFFGCVMLMMFYTTVSGWMIAYALSYAFGDLSLLSPERLQDYFSLFLSSPLNTAGFMLLTVFFSTLVCAMGLRSGVERMTKILMSILFLLLLLLAIRSCMLPGAVAGLRFYLVPNWEAVEKNGLLTMITAAMGQAFFTLSLGIGSITIFGSYIDKRCSLSQESIVIIALDTVVALLAGFIIFPACSSFGVNVESGPGLVFLSLPAIFNQMAGSRWWGALFFLFMSTAALTTVLAVFENLVAFLIDECGIARRKAAWLNGLGVALLSLPCALGFNVLKHIQPLGEGSNILDFEDYLVSDNLLPLGGLMLTLFCCMRYGWGWKNFYAEANTGSGMKLPQWLRFYMSWILPLLIAAIFILGVYARFFAKK